MAFFWHCQTIIRSYVMLKTESIYHVEKSGSNFWKMAHEHLNVFRLFTPPLMTVPVNKMH